MLGKGNTGCGSHQNKQLPQRSFMSKTLKNSSTKMVIKYETYNIPRMWGFVNQSMKAALLR